MPEGARQKKKVNKRGCVLAFLMAGIVIGATVTLFQSCGAGHDTIDAYVAAIKEGAEVTPAIGGAEAPRITEVLRASHDSSVENWIMHGGTGCFFMSVDGLDVSFLLEERSYGQEVVGIGIARGCTCPIPESNEACHMD